LEDVIIRKIIISLSLSFCLLSLPFVQAAFSQEQQTQESTASPQNEDTASELNKIK